MSDPRCARSYRRPTEPIGAAGARCPCDALRRDQSRHRRHFKTDAVAHFEAARARRVRTLFAEIPPRVEYELTELGRSFLAPLEALVAWADANHQSICNARRDYTDGNAA